MRRPSDLDAMIERGRDLVSDGASLTSDWFTTSARVWVGVGTLLLLGILPFTLSPFDTIHVIRIFYLMLFAISWDVFSGYTGELSLGHAFFFGLGGYGTATFNVHLGFSPWISILLGTVIAVLGGLLVGIPTLRLRGQYITFVTLIVPFLLLRVLIVFSGVFGGTGGFLPLPDSLAGTTSGAAITVGNFQSVVLVNYFLSFALLLVVFGITYAMTRSHVGEILTAIRENEAIVAAVGLNVKKYKIFSIAFSAAVGGLAGAMYVHSVAGSPQPSEILSLQLSLNVVIFAILGGMGTIVGPVVGVLVFSLINLLLTVIDGIIQVFDISNLAPIPSMLIAILVLIAIPDGILPWLRSIIAGRRDEN